jgi:hypothetical protein
MQVQILGPSCCDCLKLEVMVLQSLTDLGIRDARVERVTAPREVERLMWGEPPGLLINGQLVWAGGPQLPTKAQIGQLVLEDWTAGA